VLGMAAITAWGMERFHLATSSLSNSEITADSLNAPLLALFDNFFFASVFICAVAILPALFLSRKKKVSDTMQPKK